MPAQKKSTILSRRTLLGGLGAGALGAAVGLPGTAGAEDADAAAESDADTTRFFGSLRFGSFNIHHGASPDNVLDLERIAAVIEEMDVDVIGLQEVDRFWARSEMVDQPQWFSRRLRMFRAYAPNLILPPEVPGDPDREYGTLVLSRWPILWSKNTLLPRFDDHEQRGLLQTTIQAGMSRIKFHNTHLQHNNNLERQAQAEAIVDILGTDTRRTIMAGDFNAETGTPEIDTIASAFNDTWAEVGVGPGYTYNTIEPKVRIDYVWSSADTTALAAEVLTVDPLASDHLPLVARYKVRRGH